MPLRDPFEPGDGLSVRSFQKHLCLALHARRCRRPEGQCGVSYCSTMKTVLDHITQCVGPGDCRVPLCPTTRRIMSHWLSCTHLNCPLCRTTLPSRIQRERPLLDELQARRGQADLAAHGAIQVVQPAPHAPLRRLLAPQQIAPIELRGLVVEREGSAQNSMSTDMQRVYAGLGLPYFAPTQDTNQESQERRPPSTNTDRSLSAELDSSSGEPERQNGEDLTDPNEWKSFVTLDQREHLVDKIVQFLSDQYPSIPRVFLNPRIAKKLESSMLEKAGSRKEYYDLVAAKICLMEREFRRWQLPQRAAH
ncbi:histone acetyltransferase p300-like [Varroa jacobsoni]|uniref:histone acetyltransferase p300-like n=1 Tax=Varroa jacobsoni TaxID=62625 RepID=UPI000BF9E643|nr:histone acetyltransferase p300-like [Varroa jacobsoni]XP_022697000.1 histone acetyltransferase p300-like [Varroa jacobsoni]XP_022697001.1 histone acetyltransferase p300-like [Varroa jacobsoni]